MYVSRINCAHILVEKSLELEECNFLGTWEYISLELNLVEYNSQVAG